MTFGVLAFVLASARLAVDVTVESEPSGAQLMMQAGSNTGNRLSDLAKVGARRCLVACSNA